MSEKLESESAEPAVSDSPSTDDTPWHRLSPRMIWVDVVVSAFSLTPAILAMAVFNVEASWGSMWPFILIAAWGTFGAANDAIRWFTTRYRVTAHHIERRTGLISRQFRSMQRDRVRSVDIDAKLRHRVTGMRIVKVGAGQQTAAAESALTLDAIPRDDAEHLRRLLARDHAPDGVGANEEPSKTEATATAPNEHVLQEFRPSWVRFNLLNIATFFLAASFLFAIHMFFSVFGFSLFGWATGLPIWDNVNTASYIVIGIGFVTVFGMTVMALRFFATYWDFELAQVTNGHGKVLRTRHGLLRTRVVTRDVERIRGIYLGEPLLWRWMKATDIEVITTGLSMWSGTTPATILPRGPRPTVRRVADAVLDEGPSPFAVPLRRHPRAALRRRLVWATTTSVVIVSVTAWLAGNGIWSWWIPTIAVALWPLFLTGAWVAYRALGNAISGKYLISRSGLSTRMTVALQRSAVSTISVRESLLQRRLGLSTVLTATSAGWGGYDAPDMERSEAITFADEAAPGLLEPFIETLQPSGADNTTA